MVIDTHILLWYLLDDPRLPVDLRQQMLENRKGVRVCSISFWEIMVFAEKGKIAFPAGEPAKELTELFALSGFTEVAVGSAIAILSRTLPFEHNDPADRFIAATAHAMRLPLATLDGNLRRLAWLETLPEGRQTAVP